MNSPRTVLRAAADANRAIEEVRVSGIPANTRLSILMEIMVSLRLAISSCAAEPLIQSLQGETE